MKAQVRQARMRLKSQHRRRHQIGARTLNDKVHGRALTALFQPKWHILVLQQRQVPMFSQQRSRSPLHGTLSLHILQPPPNSLLVLKPCLHQLHGCLFADVQVLRQGLRLCPIHNAEIHSFGSFALLWKHRLDTGHIGAIVGAHLTTKDSLFDVRVHICSHLRVIVTALEEMFLHGRALRHMRQNAQLQLGIICHDESLAFACDESAPHIIAVLAVRGDALQVGIAAAQPSSRGAVRPTGVNAIHL
mmetsp:Transcript_81352/g.128648  ORF Transcript_81352/g.128648 Transcript_81352/m.128648 type:complete len:246 (-) Transcript_81352:1402-2139(-)